MIDAQLAGLEAMRCKGNARQKGGGQQGQSEESADAQHCRVSKMDGKHGPYARVAGASVRGADQSAM
jgi:hypothetical protein